MKHIGEILQIGFFITGLYCNFLRQLHQKFSDNFQSTLNFDNKKQQLKNENFLLLTTLPRGCCMALDVRPM